MEIIFALILIISSGVLAYIGDKDYNKGVMGLLAGATLFVMGLSYGLDTPHKTSTPITPTVEVKCTNNVCDTTYVYEFNK